MTPRTTFAVALVAALALAAALGWHATRPTPVLPPASTPPPASPLPIESVLRVRPAPAPATQDAGAATRPMRAISPELAHFRARRDYATLQRALDAGPVTPESLYLRASIYSTCARPPGKSAADVAAERTARRARLVAGLSDGVAAAAQRIDAFDRLSIDPCEGLDVGELDPGMLARMVAAAADAGDPRARAWQLAERIEGTWQGRAAPDKPAGYDLGEADFAQARALLASNDPDVIADLQGILSSTLANGSIRLGNQPVDQSAFHTALTLLACDAGASCGAEAPMVLQNCAARGRCAAGSVYEYLYYYDNSPANAQLIDSYRRTLQAMLNGGDLSGLAWSPVAPLPGFSMMFGGRRGGRPGG